MPSNIQNVSFVNPLDPGGAAAMAVQQQQIQRQQAIAQALQQQSMQDTPGNGGAVSWTQGLARMAQALAANKIYKDTGKQNVDLATKQGQAMQRMFGLGGQPQAPDQSASPIAQIAADVAPQARAEARANPMPADSAVVPPEQAQQAPQRGPMSLSGDPTQDYTDYSINPEEYSKALIASHSPNDFAKQLIQSGVDPNSAVFRQLMQAKVAKDNYVAPVNGRPGSTIRDPFDPSKVVGYDAPNIEGAMPDYGPDGMPTGYHQLPGAQGAMQGVSAAKAVGSAAGELVDVYNPATHQMVKIPKSALLSGAAGGQAPMASAPPLGANKAFEVTGANSANAFQAISDGAADVPNRILALNQMQSIVNDPQSSFGPGSSHLNEGQLAQYTGAIGQSLGIAPPARVTNYQEFSKWAAQYSARSAQELGLSGSDARVQIAVHATPNGEMSKDALKSVIPQMMGLEHAKQGYAVAANAWQQAHGPDSVQAFRTEWNKIYDPRIYTAMANGPAAVQSLLKHASPADRKALIEKSQALASLGALPK
jgi:hypothetical protein